MVIGLLSDRQYESTPVQEEVDIFLVFGQVHPQSAAWVESCLTVSYFAGQPARGKNAMRVEFIFHALHDLPG